MSLFVPSRTLIHRSAAALGTALLLASGASAQPPSAPKPSPSSSLSPERAGTIDRLATTGREARDDGRFDEARSNLTEALRVANGAAGGGVDVASAGPEVISRLLFDLGLTDQLEGETTDNPLRLDKAVQLYEEVLKARPGSAATLYNQARIYVRLSKFDLAGPRFRQAAELEGPDQPFYLNEYAHFLADRGDWASAEAFYEAVALARPQSTEAHEILLARYREVKVTGTDKLSAYLWKLVEAGEGLRAAEAAVDVLARPSAEPDLKATSILLAVVAAGIARSPIDPEVFLASPLAKRLETLDEQSPQGQTGQAGRELIGLLRSSSVLAKPEEVANQLAWWRAVAPWAESDPPHGVWPHDAMRSLLGALGRWYEQRGRTDLAEMHDRTALILVPGTADPSAARQLIDLFIARNDMAGLETFLADYESPLLVAKGVAYRKSQLAKIYEFHLTLGSLYGYLATKGKRDWQSGGVTSTLFQLEHAVEAGQLLDEAARTQGEATLHLEPGIVEYLARGYAATDPTGARSKSLRVNSALRFQAAGDSRAAAVVLAPLRLEEITNEKLRRLRSLVGVMPETFQFDGETLLKLRVEKRKLDPKILESLEIEKQNLDPKILKKLELEKERLQPPP